MRPSNVGRIRLDIKMYSETKVMIQIKDLGFGENYLSSGKEIGRAHV